MELATEIFHRIAPEPEEIKIPFVPNYLQSSETLAIIELLVENGITTWSEFQQRRLRIIAELDQINAEEFLKTYDNPRFDIMSREYLSALFGLKTEPMTAEQMNEVPEYISVEDMLLNGFKDFQHWYSR